MNKHTPGPWTEDRNPFFEFNDDYRFSISAKETMFDPAIVFGKSFSEAKANAKLIAAAPELLEALKGLVADVKRKPNDTRYATHIKIAEAAIEKATKP